MKSFIEKIKEMSLKAKIITCVVVVVVVGSGIGTAVFVSSNSAKHESSVEKDIKSASKKKDKKVKKVSKSATKKKDKAEDDKETEKQAQDNTNNQKAQVQNNTNQSNVSADSQPETQPESNQEQVDARGEACVHNCGKTVFKDQASYDSFKRFVTEQYKLEEPDDDFDISMFPASMQEYISNSEYYNIPYTYKGVTYYGGTDDTDWY